MTSGRFSRIDQTKSEEKKYTVSIKRLKKLHGQCDRIVQIAICNTHSMFITIDLKGVVVQRDLFSFEILTSFFINHYRDF